MKKRQSTLHILLEYGIAIGAAIALAGGIRFFLLEAYRMPSRAMFPAVEAGDTLFVKKWGYGARALGKPKLPAYGDIVVVEFPEEPTREYMKRVVALPGDKVKIDKGKLFLNGEERTKLDPNGGLCGKEKLPNDREYGVCLEPPLMETTEGEVTLEPGQIFVAGDFRSVPLEFRRLKPYGRVPIESIRGRASFVWLSIQPASGSGSASSGFSRIRFDRMFQGIH